MDCRGSAFPAHAAIRLVAVLLIITVGPAAAVRRIDTFATTTSADSAGTATSVDATAGASALDLTALAVDAKTQAEIKALAPLMGRAGLTGVKPPERASYLTNAAFAAAAARQWIATVMRLVQKLIRQAVGGGRKGRGSSSARGNTTTVDRSLGYVPPTTKDLAKLPNLNTVSRYLTVGLTLDEASQTLGWDFDKSVDHRPLFVPDDEFDQGNCGACC
ncbi:unnamed protein product [Closterium sp. Naga37s-1]|nr:unnamed protein product [Closterium sp. Naga37s-1]